MNMLDMLPDDWDHLMEDWGQPKYRAKQIFSWLHKGMEPVRMSNLPQALRMKLDTELSLGGAKIELTRSSQRDDTEKYLFTLEDQNQIEGVRMSYHHGDTLCVSSQVGCRMGCGFCASAKDGLIRNLTAGEMIGQVLAVNRTLPQGKRIHNIVIMGSGEPLDNYENLLRFLTLVSHPEGLNIGQRSVSVSTCGLPDKIMALADSGFHPTLSLSLHAPNDALRGQLMRVAQAYPLSEVLKAMRYYVEITSRRAILEYIMIMGVNDAPAQARELAGHLRGWQCHVNLIPMNAVDGQDFRPSDRASIQRFLDTLTQHHISATIRRTMGADIEGACGQLRRRHLSRQEERA